MSTGAWHYTEAERLLRMSENTVTDQTILGIARAHVHATLALAAATATACRTCRTNTHLLDPTSITEVNAWADALGDNEEGEDDNE